MRVIIVGAGKVGYQIAETLVEEEYDVVVIDRNPQVIDQVSDNLDVLAVYANGLLKQPLMELGVNGDDVLIAVTDSDEGNMIACLSAKNLGVGRTIARIRSPEYSKDLAVSKTDVAVDYVINPEKSTANEIARLLTFSPAGQMGDFAGGRVQMVQLPVNPDSKLSGITVQKCGEIAHILVAAISRGGRLIIPRGSDIIEAGDDIFITAKRSEITSFCDAVGLIPKRFKHVMIVGGSRISYYLAENLYHHGMSVKLIETEERRCQILSELLPHALVIWGDGTDPRLLKAENIAGMDAFVALTGRDEDNILLTLLAKQLGAGKGIAKVSRPNYLSLAQAIGVDATVTPSLITAGEILRLVRGGPVMSLFMLLGGQAEIIEFLIRPTSSVVNHQLKHLALPKEVLVTTIVRDNDVIVPRGDTVIKANDRLIVICKMEEVPAVNKLFGSQERKSGGGLWRRLKGVKFTTHR